MIQTQPPQQPDRPHSAYEIRQYIRQLDRDMGVLFREYKQRTDLLMVLRKQAYDELDLIEARQLETFDWPARPQQPQVRVAPVSMPLAQRPQVHHLHAGRMRFAEDAEAPTLPDPSPLGTPYRA